MLNRKNILDGAITRMIVAAGMADMLLSDEERNRSLRQVLAEADGEDIWVFAYGSLIWNPAFCYDERRTGTIRGYHRRFCLWVPLGRGTPEMPGLMLGLEHGGGCRGVLFRVAADHAAAELDVVWRREMVTGAYVPRWVTAVSAGGEVVRAITFVINHRHPGYAARLTEDAVADVLARAKGQFGTCAEYLSQTVGHLDEAGIHDPGLHRLHRKVLARSGAGGTAEPSPTPPPP